MTKNLLKHLWTQVLLKLNGKVDKEDGKGLSTNDYTDTEKSKLSSIEDNANNYSLPTAGLNTLGGVKTTSTEVSVGDHIACPIIDGVPYYKDTNTTYSDASSTNSGLLSATDKIKLDNASEVQAEIKEELTDIRTGADGVVYNSAGTAVRTQFNNLNTTIFNELTETTFVDVEPTIETDKSLYIRNNKVSLIDSSSGDTAVLSVSEGDVYKITCIVGPSTNVTCGYVYADDSNNVIEWYTDDTLSGQAQLKDHESTAPSGATKLYAYSLKSKGSPIIYKQVTVKVKTSKVPDDMLYGKTLLVFGDSMAYGHTIPESCWAKLLADKHRMTLINKAQNGTTVTRVDTTIGNTIYSASDSVYAKVMANLNNPVSADYIVVFGGTNDIARLVDLGTIDDTGSTTFYGALNNICQRLIQCYPDKTIVFITPYARYAGNANYDVCLQYVNAIHEVCEKHGGIPVFDNILNGGVDWNNSHQVSEITLSDSYHLNEKGHERAMRKYETFLITNCGNSSIYGVATSNSLGLVKSGTDIIVDSNGNVSVNDDSHNHIISNIDGLQNELDSKSAIGHTHSYAGSNSAGGSANSAVKLSSSKTITLQGDVTGTITTDFSGNVNSSNIERRGCSVGQNGTANTDKPWYKFASIEMTTTYTDRVIIFKVSTAGNGSSSYQTYNGILKAHIRTSGNSSITVDNAQLLWEQANTGINVDNFKLAYSNGNIELWVKVIKSYEFYVFEVLQEYDNAGNKQYWTLYTTKTIGSQSEITSGYIQVNSKLLDIQNNTNSASKLFTARTINGVSFDGSKNITLPMNSTSLSSSQNLDNVKTVGFYHASGSNAITNKPSSVDAFGLEVIQSASGWYTQILYASNNVMKSYRRWYNGSSWTSWTEDKLTDTTYSAATTSANGLMTSAMVIKLNGITDSADAVSFSRSLTSGTKIGSITINGNATDIYAPTNTDTHYSSGTIVNNSATATSNTSSYLSNGEVYLNHVENGSVKNSHKIKGNSDSNNGIQVESDSSGNITISSPLYKIVTGYSTSMVNEPTVNPYLNLTGYDGPISSHKIYGNGGTTVSSDTSGNIRINSPDYVVDVNSVVGKNSNFNLYYCKIGHIVSCYATVTNVTNDPMISGEYTIENVLPFIPASSSTFTVCNTVVGSTVFVGTVTLSSSNSNIVFNTNYSYSFDGIMFTYYTNS